MSNEEYRLVIATVQRNAAGRRIATILGVPTTPDITYDEQCQVAKTELQKKLLPEDEITYISLFPTRLVVWI